MNKFKIISLIGLGLAVFVVQSLIVNQIFDLLNLSSDIGFLTGAIIMIGQFLIFCLAYLWIFRQISKQISKISKNK